MRYTVIIKVGCDRFVKLHNVSNLSSLITYLNTKYGDWRWFNVYHPHTKHQVKSITKYGTVHYGSKKSE